VCRIFLVWWPYFYLVALPIHSGLDANQKSYGFFFDKPTELAAKKSLKFYFFAQFFCLASRLSLVLSCSKKNFCVALMAAWLSGRGTRAHHIQMCFFA
jgi:hypothetical protein